MPSKIEGREFSLKEVFSDAFVFHIPHYQRPYAWTTDEAGELLDDLLDSLGTHSGPVKELAPYFLGSIVLIKGSDPDAEVVDGQQRLITLTVLLAVLRALTTDEKVKEGTGKFLVEKGNPLLETPDRFRLTVRQLDQEFFKTYIQEEDGLERMRELNGTLTDSRRNLRDNTLLFLSRLSGFPESDRQRLGQYLVNRCYLVAVWTPSLDSAYRIFSVLNDRGLDLFHSDILKAEIIGEIPEELQADYAQKWEDAEEQLGREAFKDLFAHIRMIYVKTKLRTTTLQEFRESVCSTDTPQRVVDRTLLPMAEAYGEILSTSYVSPMLADEINRYLHWLSRIDNDDWIPPAIAYLLRNRNSPQDLVRFFRDLERLAAGMMIVRAYVNRRIERYGTLLKAIEAGADLYANGSPLQLTDEERLQISNALDGDIYGLARVRLPVLLRLDAALSKGEASYDYRIITVEHVLPQTLSEGSQWVKWFPDKETRAQYTHRLGNLVLLSRSKNTQAGNFDFERKKKEYFVRKGVAPFALTSQVLMEDEWTPEVVQRRQEQLLKTLKQEWRL